MSTKKPMKSLRSIGEMAKTMLLALAVSIMPIEEPNPRRLLSRSQFMNLPLSQKKGKGRYWERVKRFARKNRADLIQGGKFMLKRLARDRADAIRATRVMQRRQWRRFA